MDVCSGGHRLPTATLWRLGPEMDGGGRRRRRSQRCITSDWKPVAAQLQAGQEALAAQCCLTHTSQYRKCRHGSTTQLRCTCRGKRESAAGRGALRMLLVNSVVPQLSDHPVARALP